MKKIIAIVVVVLVVVLGGVYFFSSSLKSPQDRVKNAFSDLFYARNGHIKVDLVTKTKDSTVSGLSEFKVIVDGDYQKNTGETLETAATVAIEGVGQGTTLKGSGEVRLVGGKLFYKIDVLPPVFPGIEQIIGKWIPGSENISLLPEKATQNLAKSFGEQQLFTDIKKIGSEKVGKYRTTHYQVKLSPAGYANFVEQFLKLSNVESPLSKEELQKSIETASAVPFDVWVDFGNKLRKITVSYNQQAGSNTLLEIYFSPFTGTSKIEAPNDVLRPAETTPVSSSMPSALPLGISNTISPSPVSR